MKVFALIIMFALCTPLNSTVLKTTVSPDGKYQVSLIDRDSAFQFELYSMVLPYGVITQLNPEFSENRNALNFEISPLSGRVVYTADYGAIDQEFNAYSVPISGGSSIVINNPLPYDWDIDTLRISPNGQRVIYHAGQVSSGKWELYSASITGPGGAAVKINRPMGVGGAVDRHFYITSDSALVVYRADAERNGEHQVYAVPLLGGLSRLLSLPLAPGGDVRSVELLPGDIVRYEADLTGGGVWRWYVVPARGGAVLVEILTDGFESGGATKWQ